MDNVIWVDEHDDVFWAKPKDIYEEMKDDPGNEKFCGGFKASLRFFLTHKKLL